MRLVRGDLDIVEEQRIGRVVHHHAERPHLEALEPADVDQEDADSPSVFCFTWSTGVVRASSSIRSDWSTREMNIFWPLTM